MKPLAFLDTETTGTHAGARVIEIAVVTFRPDGVRDGEFSTLLRGDGSVGSVGAQRVHGISTNDLIGAPDFAEVWVRVQPMLSGRVLVAHNAPFDQRMIDHELRTVRQRPLPPMACTMRMAFDLGYARRRLGDDPGSSARLQDLTKRLSLEVTPTHRALADTEAAAALFWHFHARHRSSVEAYVMAHAPFGPPTSSASSAGASVREPEASGPVIVRPSPNPTADGPTPGRRWRPIGR